MNLPSVTIQNLRSLHPSFDQSGFVSELAKERLPHESLHIKKLSDAGASFMEVAYVAIVMAMEDDDFKRLCELWVADCAARVLLIFEAKYPNDTRPRNAIVAARKYSCKQIDSAERLAASIAAFDAIQETGGDDFLKEKNLNQHGVWAAATAAARAARWEPVHGFPELVLMNACIAARYSSDHPHSVETEESFQVGRFFKWFSDAETESLPLPPITKEAA